MDVSQTAQVNIPNIASALGWLNNPMVAVAVGFMGASAKAIYSEVKSLVASAITLLASKKGVALTKDVTVIAADLQQALVDAGHPEPAKVSSVINGLLAQVPSIAKVSVALLLALCLAGVAHAEVALSYGGLFGSSTWNIGDGGKLVATGSTLAGAEMNFAYGSVSGTAFTPDAVVALGGAWETQNGNEYADLVLGAGPTIPGTEAPLIVGPAWRLFSGDKYPSIMISTTFDFGQPFWVGK